MQAELRDSLENTLLDLHHSTRNYGGKNGSPQVGRICSRIWLLLFVFLNITLLVWNLSILTTHKSQSKNTRCAIQSADSPASHTLMPKKILFHKYSHWTSPFSKKPGPIVDAAWHEQLEGMNIRVSKDWFDRYNVESIPLADGSGYVAQLVVYHELHCLKKLKHLMCREWYYKDISQAAMEEEESHAEHCLELLRVASLCRSDTTLTTFQWGGPNGTKLETEYPIPHQCIDHEKVLGWSKAHAVDIGKKGILRF